MSDRPIQVGDLVLVVKPAPCCGVQNSFGPYKVLAIDVSVGICGGCFGDSEWNVPRARLSNGQNIPIVRLKRIPPLSELEGERTDEQIKEPA
jgi:hypothetical protein